MMAPAASPAPRARTTVRAAMCLHHCHSRFTCVLPPRVHKCMGRCLLIGRALWACMPWHFAQPCALNDDALAHLIHNLNRPSHSTAPACVPGADNPTAESCSMCGSDETTCCTGAITSSQCVKLAEVFPAGDK